MRFSFEWIIATFFKNKKNIDQGRYLHMMNEFVTEGV